MERYLGDGVYAAQAGDMIKLDLREQGESVIYLDRDVTKALIKFAVDMGLVFIEEEDLGRL